MKIWSLFYPEILPDLPLASAPLVEHWLRNAAIDFCERSKCNVVALASVDSVAGTREYSVPLAADTDLVELVSVRYLGDKLTPVSPAFLEAEYDDWESETGTPLYYSQPNPDTVILVPAPDATNTAGIRLRAAIKPGDDALGVDDWIFSKYRDEIVCGAKAALMAMENAPWANPDMVVVNSEKFEEGISRAATASRRGFVLARPRVSARFF